MKIRNYKGPSLDKLYEVIRDELGSEAIVVSQRKATGTGFLARRQYELIAVVDDGATETHLLSHAAKPEDIQKLSVLESKRWRAMEGMLQGLQDEVRNISANQSVSLARPSASAGLPDFARDWDPRFTKVAEMESPEVVAGSDTDIVEKGLARLLRVDNKFTVKKSNGRPHVIVLVGPTGSGKTTTLAKLAARWCLDKKLKVGLVTTDTYRIAAVDQAREYATLLGLDLKVAFSAGEAVKAVHSFSDRDVILVDTPGRNHCDPVAMAALNGTLSSMGEVTTFLLLPATISCTNAKEILQSFRALNPNYLIITKTDEVKQSAMLTTVACESACPMVYVTDGQRVPQDIHHADHLEIAKIIMGKESRVAEPAPEAQQTCPPKVSVG